MLLGKAVRLERIFNRNTGRTIIVPMDHGVSVGPIYGLVDLKGAVDDIAEGGANAVLMHKGMPRCTHRGRGKDVGLIIHLSASTSLSPSPNSKVMVGGVEDALRLGADGVSIHVNLGDENEGHMLESLGELTSRATEWGMPVLAMMYARGKDVSDPYDPDVVRHCARVGVELGADVIKVPYTGDIKSFSTVVDACCVPVVIAGGPKMDNDQDLLRMVHDSIQAGGAGLSVGRNIFQHHTVSKLLRALNGIVHLDWDLDQAEEFMNSGEPR